MTNSPIAGVTICRRHPAEPNAEAAVPAWLSIFEEKMMLSLLYTEEGQWRKKGFEGIEGCFGLAM